MYLCVPHKSSKIPSEISEGNLFPSFPLKSECSDSKFMYSFQLPERLIQCSDSIRFVVIVLTAPRIFICTLFWVHWRTSLVAQTVKRLSTMPEIWVQSLGREDPLEKEMAIHSSTIARKIPWTEKPGRLQSTGRKESDTTERLHFHFHCQAEEPTVCRKQP